jgi:D-tyrosyl-tRNA(Tyr) deacylase
MKILLQRVNCASVTVAGELVGQIDRGLLLLVGFGRNDTEPDLVRARDKIINLRVFSNENNRLDRSLLDIGGAILAIPQFTLYGQTRKGRRPDFTDSLDPVLAETHFDSFIQLLHQTTVINVKFGVFGAEMAVSLVNDGPFTLMLEY